MAAALCHSRPCLQAELRHRSSRQSCPAALLQAPPKQALSSRPFTAAGRLGRSRPSRGLTVRASYEPEKPSDLKEPERFGSRLTKPAGLGVGVNVAYLGVTGALLSLMLFRNPYIYAVLSIATIIPQNSNVTSLNTLVVWAYESGLFMNFAEAVNVVRLVTWLSIILCLVSFALFT